MIYQLENFPYTLDGASNAAVALGAKYNELKAQRLSEFSLQVIFTLQPEMTSSTNQSIRHAVTLCSKDGINSLEIDALNSLKMDTIEGVLGEAGIHLHGKIHAATHTAEHFIGIGGSGAASLLASTFKPGEWEEG